MNRKHIKTMALLMAAMTAMSACASSRPPSSSSSMTYGSGDREVSLKHDGIIRKYKVHLPPGYDKAVSHPLVIYLHGGGGDRRAAYMDGVDKAADQFGFILVIPEGTGEVKYGHLRASWNGGKWQSGECCGNADDVGFMILMLDEIKRNYPVDSKRIYATGISNGGFMTNRLACELADKIAAIATVAPTAVESNCKPSRPVPVMHIHGTADPCNPYDGSNPTFGLCARMPYKRMSPQEDVAAWLKLNKCTEQSDTAYQKGKASCIQYNHCDNGAEVEFCTVQGMGHTWPSGAQYLPASMVGAVSYDLSFEQIWEFFKKHSLGQ